MWTAIATLLGLLVLLVKAWLANSPDRRAEWDQAAEQRIRRAIATGDAAALSRRIDELRTEARAHHLSTGQQPDGAAPGRGPGPL